MFYSKKQEEKLLQSPAVACSTRYSGKSEFLADEFDAGAQHLQLRARNHPMRPLRERVNEALKRINEPFNLIYADASASVREERDVNAPRRT